VKLLIIGAGTVGRHIAIAASALPPFSHIIVADRDAARAATVAGAVGGEARTVDARDTDALTVLMREADVVISAVGPATSFGVPMLRAAIAAGCRYLDLCDDPHPTLAMLELDEEARMAGATAIIGAGASPGVVSLLAVEAASRLDEVERVLTGWGDDGTGDDDEEFQGEASAALQHWVEQASGTIPILHNGKIIETKPLTAIDLDYPGIGVATVRSIGHPEPVTLARRFPNLRESINVMNFPSYVFACLEEAAAAVDAGGSIKDAAEMLRRQLGEEPSDSIFSKKAMRYAWHQTQDRIAGKRWLPPLWALAEGTSDGRPMRVGASLAGAIPGGMGPATGIPAAIFASMLASGAVLVGPGVHSPELAFSPADFFERLRPFLRDAVESTPSTPCTVAFDPDQSTGTTPANSILSASQGRETMSTTSPLLSIGESTAELDELEQALPFAGLSSFMKAPVSRSVKKGNLVVAGVPFDAGATNRPGTRYGPRAIREQSHYATAFLPVYPWPTTLGEKHRIVDFGDIAPFPGSGCLEMMLDMTEAVTSKVLKAGARMLLLGGDHTLPFGPIRAASKHFGKLALVHLDAHQDSYPVPEFEGHKLYNHGVFATELVAEGCIDVTRSTQAYIRTIQPETPGGYDIVYANDALRMSPEDLAKRIRDRAGDSPVYLTLDIDAVDPSHAPGTGSPVPGGPTVGEVRRLLKALEGINLVGADLVEVNPLYDPTEITAVAAAHLAIDILHLMEAGPSW
jgi:agmatinase